MVSAKWKGGKREEKKAERKTFEGGSSEGETPPMVSFRGEDPC